MKDEIDALLASIGGGLVGTVIPQGYVSARPGTVYFRTGTQPYSFWAKTSGGNTSSGWTQFIGNDADSGSSPNFDTASTSFDNNAVTFDNI